MLVAAALNFGIGFESAVEGAAGLDLGGCAWGWWADEEVVAAVICVSGGCTLVTLRCKGRQC